MSQKLWDMVRENNNCPYCIYFEASKQHYVKYCKLNPKTLPTEQIHWSMEAGGCDRKDMLSCYLVEKHKGKI